MHSAFPFLKTAWVIHCQLAQPTEPLMREMRLLAYTKDDGTAGMQRSAEDKEKKEDIEAGKKKGELPPWQEALGFRDKIFGITSDRLLQSLSKHSGDEKSLESYLVQYRDEIAASVYEHGGHSFKAAKKVIDAINEKTIGPRDIHHLIEELLTPKPEKEETLAAILKAPEKKETKKEKASRWQKLLKQIATLSHPLYRSLSKFLGNAAVEGIGLSPDTIFAGLGDKSKRLNLFRMLASTRHDLVLERTENVDVRLEALNHLHAVLDHGRFMLAPEERGEFFEFFARVSAARMVVEEEAERKKQNKPQQKNEEQAEALQESEDIRRFLSNQRERKHSIRGEDGLQLRLEQKAHEAGSESNAYALLAKSLRPGEWLESLNVSESLKYTCILIALEEVAILKHQIALDHAGEPSNLLEKIKDTVFAILRRGSRGFPQDRAVLAITHDTTKNAREDFEALEIKIANEEHPEKADIEEILVLYAWIRNNDHTFDSDGTKKRQVEQKREHVEVSREELEEESARARTELSNSLEQISPIRGELLQNGGTSLLLYALTDLQEERMLDQRRRNLMKKKNVTEKDLQKINREPSLLHKECDEAYQKNFEALVTQGKTSNDPEIIALKEEYEREKELRNNMHSALIREQEEKLLAAIEADIHAEAANLIEGFTTKIWERIRKQSGNEALTVEEFSKMVQALDWADLPTYIREEEMETIRVLDRLRHCSLQETEIPAKEAATLIHDLARMQRDVGEKNKGEVIAKETKANAQTIVNDESVQHLPEEFTAPFKALAEGEARSPGGIVAKGTKLFADNPNLIAQIFPVWESEESLDEVPMGETELEVEFQKVRNEIFDLLTSPSIRENASAENFQIPIDQEIGRAELAIRNAAKGDHKSASEAKTRLKTLTAFKNALKELGDPAIVEEKSYDEFVEYVEERRKEKKSSDPDFAWAVYDRKRKKIILNREKIEGYGGRAKEAVLAEERAHGFHEAFRTLFPTAFSQLFESTIEHLPEDLRKEFIKLGKQWITEGSKTERAWRDDVMDEFLAKRQVFRKYRDTLKNKKESIRDLPLRSDEIRFFERMEEWETMEPVELRFEEIVDGETRSILMAAKKRKGKGGKGGGGAPGGPAPAPGATPAAPGAPAAAPANPNAPPRLLGDPPRISTSNGYREGSETARQISDIQNNFIMIDNFSEVFKGDLSARNAQVMRELKARFEAAYTLYKGDRNAESKPEITNEITSIENVLKAIIKEIGEFDAKQRLKLQNAPVKKDWWFRLWNEMELMSVSDFVAIYKAIAEDIKRQHTRRQQRRIGHVGESLTSWFRNVPILRELPYFSTVSSEFHRRDKSSELEEINKWSEALKDDDSYELQEALHIVQNKDQMKAILNLLSERGRIDWEDTKFWETLNRLSRYKMPIEECLRDESLREDWLRKILGDIYADKEIYRGWKSKNDHAIESGKHGFTPEADRLSNLKGGLAGELEKQLQLFINIKQRQQRGENISMPDDVHPHLYEEIIDYSIRNGKMSMEEKFFYLVQGLAYGIIAMDRLRELAGEGGEILNIFPFIDYFSGKNNTHTEVVSLAQRLRETDDTSSENFYKPGIRTTLWLELEVGREQRVQERLRKGVDRRAGEMDHDDMHYFIPRLDLNKIRAMATPQGGGRQQMTTDGWRNAYVGYNGFFKSLGMLSQLEEERQDAKFTSEDVYQTIRAVAGFIQMDGIMTIRSNYGDTEGRRPSIPHTEMKNSFAVCSNGETVWQDRQAVNGFVKQVLQAYRNAYITDEYIETVLYETEGRGTPDREKQDEIHSETKKLPDYLAYAVKEQGSAKLKKLLRDSMNVFHSDKDYTYENAKILWRDFSRRELVSHHGSGHGAHSHDHEPSHALAP